ncbi:MAG: hypothetical protein WCT18_02125 [Patescibacteria group bacterium]
MDNEKLAEGIIKTLSYFSLYEYPLTGFELQTYLISQNKNSNEQVSTTLNELKKIKAIDFAQGFYFLFGENEIIKKRLSRYTIFLQKTRKTKRYLKLISLIPFVNGIFICNELSLQNSKNESDIDLAIITAKNKIWFCRFWANLLMKFLHARPTSKNKKNKICLSFWLDENHLNLERISTDQNIRLAFWLRTFWPVFLNDELILKKLRQENRWLGEFFSEFSFSNTTEHFNLKKNNSKFFLEKILSKRIGTIMNCILKKIQLHVLPKKIKELAKRNNSGVIISDQILKLHLNDDRATIKTRWQLKYQKVLENKKDRR